MNYTDLLESVRNAAALRLRLRLQPMYGQGEIVFPCTVAGGKYQISNRRIPGNTGSIESLPCAILDSVQSQANRMEDALLSDIRAGNLHLPHLETDFTEVKDLEKTIGKITCFEAPHRIFDAILRDSVDEKGVHFPLTELGKKVIKANAKDASPIFQVSPASLLFGSWDSTGVSGGLGEKYTRCVVSEVVGINQIQADRAGTRVDPLNLSSSIDPDKILKDTKDVMWSQIAKNRKNLKKPSELNHSSVIWPKEGAQMHGGVTVDYIQQSTTISFPALRQLHFPVGGKDQSSYAHAVLAAIALHAATLNVARGWHLRSRCDLVLEDGVTPQWEILGGASGAKQTISADATREVLKEAIAKAKEVGLPWNEQPIFLKPSPALEKLVVASQKAHRETATAE